MGDPKHIADELSSWLQKVEQAPSLARDRKRDMVLFLDRVVEVVEQSFREILRLSVELRYMTEDELTPTDLRGYLKNVEMLQARDKYRDVEFICGRLHVLKQQFHDSPDERVFVSPWPRCRKARLADMECVSGPLRACPPKNIFSHPLFS